MNEKHFEERDGTYLNKLGKIVYVSYFEKFMNKTFYHPTLKRKITLFGLVKREVKKLKKSILFQKPFTPLGEYDGYTSI